MSPSSSIYPRFPLAHTYSIVARDSATGQMGVAVQSHWFSVGSVVPWGRSGVGVVATQAMTEISYGPLGLDLMQAGKSASEALKSLLASDERRDVRQVALVDANGNAAAHTGMRCMQGAGHEIGPGFSCQANMMLNRTVWHAMAQAYTASSEDLAGRLLAALQAGEEEGGDVRGQQSAALLIVDSAPSTAYWVHRIMDLRVEDHLEPVNELIRLVNIQRAYNHMNLGDDFLSRGQVEEALEAYQTATQMAPCMVELPFWQAVTLADLGRVDEALPIFREVFANSPNFAELVQRLPPVGMLREDAAMMARILAVCETAP